LGLPSILLTSLFLFIILKWWKSSIAMTTQRSLELPRLCSLFRNEGCQAIWANIPHSTPITVSHFHSPTRNGIDMLSITDTRVGWIPAVLT
jgi:hypothetical protein